MRHQVFFSSRVSVCASFYCHGPDNEEADNIRWAWRLTVESEQKKQFFILLFNNGGKGSGNHNDVNFSNTERAQSYIRCCRLAMEEIQQIYKMSCYY